MTDRPPDIADPKRPRGRFTIRFAMGLTLAVAGVLGMYAPELRSIDKSRGILLFSLAMAASFFICFTPVWAILLSFRRRAGRREPTRKSHYVLLFTAFLFCLFFAVLSVFPVSYFAFNF